MKYCKYYVLSTYWLTFILTKAVTLVDWKLKFSIFTIITSLQIIFE